MSTQFYMQHSIHVMALSTSLSSQGLVTTESLFDGDEQPTDLEVNKGTKYLIDLAPNLRTLPSECVVPLTTNPLLVRDASIPVIDMSGYDRTPESKNITIQAINSVCVEWGIFRVINHGIKKTLMEELLVAVEEFFNLPFEEKMKYTSDDKINPLAHFGTNLATSPKQWMDYLRHQSHNIDDWPNNPSNYRNLAKAYLEETWQMTMKIVSAMSEGLGLESDYIEKSSIGEGTQLFAANHYPPCPEPEKIFGIKPHTDRTFLTVLLQNDIDGLQVEYEQEWVAVGHVPGSFVVVVGESLEILSNGRYKSVYHRSVTNAERTRITLAVGIRPKLTALVAPASPLVDGKSEIKYRHITFKDYILLKRAIGGEKPPLQAIMVNDTTNVASSCLPQPKLQVTA